MAKTYIFPVTIYYEDTDITGLVYHPNYFKYFERARSELIGADKLRHAQEVEGVSVAVYKADIVFKKGAGLGDRLEIHTTPSMAGEYRVLFNHRVLNAATESLLVEANVELVAIYQEKLYRIPQWIADKVSAE